MAPTAFESRRLCKGELRLTPFHFDLRYDNSNVPLVMAGDLSAGVVVWSLLGSETTTQCRFNTAQRPAIVRVVVV